MTWTFKFSNLARQDFKILQKTDQERIRKKILEIMQGDPRLFGKQLKGQLSDCWSYRIGDYRMICEI